MFNKRIILFTLGFILTTSTFAQEDTNHTQSAGFSNLIESTLVENQAIQDPTKAESLNLITLQAGIKNLYAYNPESKTDYSSINSSILLEARVVPEEMRQANRLVSRFGSVYVTPAKFNNPYSYDAFNIVYKNVDSRNCINIVKNTASSFSKVAIENIVVKDSNRNIDKANNKLLAKQCNARKNNKIIFTSI